MIAFTNPPDHPIFGMIWDFWDHPIFGASTNYIATGQKLEVNFLAILTFTVS